jgi:hypothetical protein
VLIVFWGLCTVSCVITFRDVYYRHCHSTFLSWKCKPCTCRWCLVTAHHMIPHHLHSSLNRSLSSHSLHISSCHDL